ncbi:YscQ/HrcQ family type III secretion apparatus protein [Paraburkholderia sp. UYCP14C]|uniref:type III secretion system cytoplasmic ring protein SctQ n=1 Tax=Paraburkholderia sp. UYCP14C TaxID=2511130 RepID=UPI0010225B8C|nr:type III secretion system cytoplasmic ring protein SctQ [Paraburkholderia sp. UYCP14C]RZF23808.1 YscQ/HrcQ family type III secretion apparatus protein [Paraburkholderia sp. UYCP14C]
MGYSIAKMSGVGVAAEHAASPAAQPAAIVDAGLRAAAQTTPIGVLPLHAVPQLVARLARLVCHAGTVQCIQRNAAIAEWQATPEAAAEGPSAPFSQPGVLDLVHPAGAIRVLFDLAAYPALEIAALPDGAPVPGDPARALRIAVAGVLLAPLLKRLTALGFAGMHLTQLTRGVPPASNGPDMLDARDGAAFTVTFSVDGTRHRARVLPAAPVVGALEAWHAARTAQFTADAITAHASSQMRDRAWPLSGCTVPGRLILGSRRLPVDTLRALQPGDVLLRSLQPRSGAGHIVEACATHAAQGAAAESQAAPLASTTVAWGSPGLMRIHAPVNIEGRRLSLTKEPIMTDELDPVRPDDLLAPDQQSNPIDIGELDLPVQFEVDTVALPLSQLYALRPGYVIELPTPVNEAQIKLVTHGQTIGYGELVTVGDHLGIRILRMAHGDGPVQ